MVYAKAKRPAEVPEEALQQGLHLMRGGKG
jgi:hypothetical protein